MASTISVGPPIKVVPVSMAANVEPELELELEVEVTVTVEPCTVIPGR